MGGGITCWVMSVNRTKDSGNSPSIVRFAFSEIIFIIIIYKAHNMN